MNLLRPPTFLPLVSLAAILQGSCAFAGDDDHGFYLGADVGGAVAKNSSLREYPDAPPGGTVRFDTGARLGLHAGYRLNEWLSLGLETGFIANEIKGADAALLQAPFLGAVEFRLPNKSPIQPFVGGGPGISFSILGINNDTLVEGGTDVDGAASDAVFAWQIYGGLRFRITDHLTLGAVYKYFGADAPSWSVENASQDVSFGKARVHSVSAVFTANF